MPFNRVEAMKPHALAKPDEVETMGLTDSQKSLISRGFREIVDMFPLTKDLKRTRQILIFSDEIGWICFRERREALTSKWTCRVMWSAWC